MDQMRFFRPTLTSLFKALTSDTKTLLRQEIQLAKTELSEKISRMGKNTVLLAVGGFIAYAGAIVLLLGIGWLIGFGLEAAGVSPVLARALGITGIGLIVVIAGYVMLRKGLNTLKGESLTPERTVQTLQELKSTTVASEEIESAQSQEKLTSEQLQERVEATETRMGDTLDELGYRLSPGVIKDQVSEKISANPYRAGLIAAAIGLASGWLVKRKFQKA